MTDEVKGPQNSKSIAPPSLTLTHNRLESRLFEGLKNTDTTPWDLNSRRGVGVSLFFTDRIRRHQNHRRDMPRRFI